MVHLRPRLPSRPHVDLTDVLAHAARDADSVPGMEAQVPWQFRRASALEAGLLEGLGDTDQQWILVTCRCTRGDQTQERAFTAVQRYLLSLAVAGVEATWIGSGFPPELDLHLGADDGGALLGVIRIDL
ncbi:MAG: hypothetical protein AAF791_07015 [Bacteroidota bacterium]